MKLHGNMVINSAGHLEIGGCDTVQLAREFGTPLWVMDENYIRQQCRLFKKAFIDNSGGDAAYASKAFLTQAMAAVIKEEGLSLDVVSGGELFTALQAGFPARRIYFHGNNKSREELKMAIQSRVGRIVVDNFYELTLLEEVIHEIGDEPVPVMLRIAPGVEAHTHEYVQTGQEDTKFGFSLASGQALEAGKRVLKSEFLTLKGIHCHIGSQIFETDSFAAAAEIMIDFIAQIYKKTGYLIGELNLGGGFGIYYSQGDAPKTIEEYAENIISAATEYAEMYGVPVPRIIVEPGRSIVGPAGTTLYTVGSCKDIPGIRKYISVDGGMADNIRTALYGAVYEGIIANKALHEPVEIVTVAGKCCESGDILIKDISLPLVEPGDILAISCTGAYGYTMASNYNRLPRPAVVLVRDGQADIIVRRETYEDLLRQEAVPRRLRDNGNSFKKE
ncbi:MAG: diaminopimelate decarboxylase [Bacillota bacterium]